MINEVGLGVSISGASNFDLRPPIPLALIRTMA